MPEYVTTDKNRAETGVIPASAELDLEIGPQSQNDFALTIPTKVYDKSKIVTDGYLYCQGTEYGGKMLRRKSSTGTATVTMKGDTWRGMLAKKVVKPASGQSVRTLSGDLNTIISTLIGDIFGGVMVGKTTSAGKSVTGWKTGYMSLLDVLNQIMESVDYRLKITADAITGPLTVTVEAVPVVDRSADVEVSQDMGITYTVTESSGGYTHMTAVGGEGDEQIVVYLKRSKAGKVTEVDSIPEGPDVREYLHISTQTDKDQLIAEATEQFMEICEGDEQEVDIDSQMDDMPIGDIVGGRDYVTGITVAQPITQKVIKYTDGRQTIQYKTGG